MTKNNRNNSTDLSQNVHEEKGNQETRKSFEDSSATEKRGDYDGPRKNRNMNSEDEGEGSENTREMDSGNSKHNANGSKEEHIRKIRQALRMLEEEVAHLEGRSGTATTVT